MKAILVNPPIPKTFWSFESVLEITGKSAVMPPLGLITVAALLPDDWDLKLIDMTFEKPAEQDWDECDVVLTSGMSVQYHGILDVVREGKRRGKTVLVGGPWAFHFPEEALRAGADLVVAGEGELTVPRLLEHLRRGESGIIIRAEGLADMETSPPPRYDILDLDRYLNVSIQFSRGCPFQCEFCDVTLMLGHKVRTKRPAQVLTELDMLYRSGCRGYIFVVDDNFAGSSVRAKELLRAMAPWQEAHGRPFQFYTQASVNMAGDEELLDLMVDAGFYKVFLGIETLDEESLKGAKKNQNVATDPEWACERINRAGLGIIAGCIIGFDDEKPGADRRLIDFARRTNIPEMFGSLLQAPDGTALWHRLKKEGRLLEGAQDRLGNQTSGMNFTPTRPFSQIVREFVNLYEVLYARDFYLDRAFRHVTNMKRSKVKKPAKMPRLYELRAVFTILLRHGVLYPSRLKFWKYLGTLLWSFPEQVPRFLDYCVAGEHYSDFLYEIKEGLSAQRTDPAPSGDMNHPPVEASSR
ncbi:MAG: B12-binding domain-containing radical SAM protein [Pseudomonadota bacterium]